MMAKKILYALVFMMVITLMVGCAAPKAKKFRAINLTAKMKAGLLAQKVDNFLVILDSSASMAQIHQGRCKLDTAKGFVSEMNQTIPDIFLMAGLRKFGPHIWSYSKKSELVYGMTQYTKEGLEAALKPIKWAGDTPLTAAIDAATGDLKSVRGDMAVIIVTDGLEVGDAAGAAQRMKKAYGDRVCIYPVLVGNDTGGKTVLEKVAAAGECGFATTVADASGSVNMADFVQKVFLKGAEPAVVAVPPKPAPPGDSDGDGVIDAQDKCPDTPRGVEVGGDGCPFDTDMDGVPDYLDQCPKTPVSAPVDGKGCWIIRPVEFDTNKWDIKAWYNPVLDQAATVLKRNPWLEVIIEGHTDNRGTAKFNQRLSEKRAKAVMDYLVKKGLNREKLTPVGYGYSKPTASNDTPEGQAQNRRAEIRFLR